MRSASECFLCEWILTCELCDDFIFFLYFLLTSKKSCLELSNLVSLRLTISDQGCFLILDLLHQTFDELDLCTFATRNFYFIACLLNFLVDLFLKYCRFCVVWGDVGHFSHDNNMGWVIISCHEIFAVAAPASPSLEGSKWGQLFGRIRPFS